MRLSELSKAIREMTVTTGPDGSARRLDNDPRIESIHYRAQTVDPGGLFVAITGSRADGHDFVQTAIARGAAALVVEKEMSAPVPVIVVHNTRRALAHLAAKFYASPSTHLKVVGITGTNGKTTTAYLLESILIQAGCRVGVIGTVEYRYAGKSFENPVTTPESLELQRILAEMQAAGISHVVMEVSSHALDQFRVENCWFDLGVFTNLTQDHLDYHRSMDAYWLVKKRLFTEVLGAGPKRKEAAAVINTENSYGRELLNQIDQPAVAVGRGKPADVRLVDLRQEIGGMTGTIATSGGEIRFQSRLVGEHNAENILCAAGAALSLEIAPEAVQRGIDRLAAVPGRLEPVPNSSGKHVFVDYAHTPDALSHALQTLNRFRSGRLICVFGCGGDRDAGKRPLMGRIAVEASDLVLVTSDNPRSEPPMGIIAQICGGIDAGRFKEYRRSELTAEPVSGGYAVEPDRRRAIATAIAAAQKGDIVLIAGKGHETYQLIGKTHHPFDDRRIAAQILEQEPETGEGIRTADSPAEFSWSVRDILNATGGELICGDPAKRFSGIGIDSRRIDSGEMFVAIRGAHHDGHRFADEVIAGGGSGVLVTGDEVARLPVTRWSSRGAVCIAVEDTVGALGALGAYQRERSEVSVVAITGSNGKTTTRQMTFAVMGQRFCTLSTRGNLNNEIGLPLTLLRLQRRHRWAVVELGMNHPGEIARLARICRPDIGMVSNIGPAHLEGLGDLAGVREAKGELIAALGPDGVAVLNADDPQVVQLARKASGRIIWFGLAPHAAVRGQTVRHQARGVAFELILPDERIEIRLSVSGRFMVSNALAAAAVGHYLGLTAREIKSGLETFRPVAGRMRILRTGKGVNVIDDAYNANPGSMKAAIATLKELKDRAHAFLVAGDMLELGAQSEALHREIGAAAAEAGIDRVYAIGRYADAVVEGARTVKRHPETMTGTQAEIEADLIRRLNPGDWILIKGSRAMGLESLVDGIVDACGGIWEQPGEGAAMRSAASAPGTESR